MIKALEENLVDPRRPLASKLPTMVFPRSMGWIDFSDTDTLRRDPLYQLACSDACGG